MPILRVIALAALLVVSAAQAAVRWADVLKQPADWYASGEAVALAENLIRYQSPEGGWQKNRDMTLPPEANRDSKEAPEPTIDNDATTTQLEFIARVISAGNDGPAFKESFLRGFDYLLEAQYANGGWPQFYPLREGYYTHITFNDDAMVHVLRLLRASARNEAPFAWIDAGRRARAAVAVGKGIDCILRCQIEVNGVKTAWCAQHDEKTFAPAPARKYEHISLSGFESVGIVRFLMGEDSPSPEIIAAVHAAVAWFKQVQLHGIREDHPPNPGLPHGFDRVMVKDPDAPPLWARFYEIGTNRPIYSGRDSIVRYDLAEVEPERRGGYRWHTQEPLRLLEKDYPAWARKWPAPGSIPDVSATNAADAVVAADGSGDYTSVQEAISAAPMRTGADDPRWVIRVKPGVYKERIYVQRERGNITVVGDDAATTVITFGMHANMPGPDGKPIGTFRTPTVQIDGDGFEMRNLTIANSAGEPGPRPDGPAVVQALALRADGDRVAFRNCRFLGWQDTILVNRGRHYFADCYIEGHVDFIFGAATAFFERCHIHCLRDGYITAASTPDGQAKGFVFADCTITGAEGAHTYLGRPWREFAKTVFIRTEMSDVVRPEGWNNWKKPGAEKTTFYREFGNTGPGSAVGGRAAWARLLGTGEVARYTPAIVLGGADGWNPAPGPAVHFIGDSTMADKGDSGFPERGWGQLLRGHVLKSWRFVNHAANGRSTVSFRTLGHWDTLMAQLHKGDWVVIEFAHNDEKKEDPDRYADPGVAFPENLRRMIAEVRSRGAHPVLATPVVRRQWAGDGTLVNTHGAYVGAVSAVAESTGVPLLDMERITRGIVTAAGPEESKRFYVIFGPGKFPGNPEGRTDNTHFSEEGARVVAAAAATELSRLGAPFVSQ